LTVDGELETPRHSPLTTHHSPLANCMHAGNIIDTQQKIQAAKDFSMTDVG
jgi:hypothetical protein